MIFVNNESFFVASSMPGIREVGEEDPKRRARPESLCRRVLKVALIGILLAFLARDSLTVN